MSTGDEARMKILRRKKVEEAMEAAFDNDLDTFKAVLAKAAKEKIPLPMAVKKGEDSFLGEAACGNATDVVAYLLSDTTEIPTHEIDVNHPGKHNRTPLVRAMYNEALDVIPVLLERGADPRLALPQEHEEPSEEFPEGRIIFRDWDPNEFQHHSNITPGAKKILSTWDINVTLRLLAQRSGQAAVKQEADAARQRVEAQDAEGVLAQLTEEYNTLRERLSAAQQLVEKRIAEYDLLHSREGKSEEQLLPLDGLIKEAMADVKACQRTLPEVELRLRKKQKEVFKLRRDGGGGGSADATASAGVDRSISLEALQGVVLSAGRAGGEDGSSNNDQNKLCYIIDTTENGASFLTYRGITPLDYGVTKDTLPDSLRLSLLGSIRFGMPLVVNMRAKPIDEALRAIKGKFEAVESGLWAKVLDRSIAVKPAYEGLITPQVLEADPELHPGKFDKQISKNFVFVMMSTLPPLNEGEALKSVYSVLVE